MTIVRAIFISMTFACCAGVAAGLLLGAYDAASFFAWGAVGAMATLFAAEEFNDRLTAYGRNSGLTTRDAGDGR
jgi:hypothetical protein